MSKHNRGPALGKHLSMPQLLAYAAAPIAMMIFTSVYGVVDGFFISNFAGKTAFAAVNLIMPAVEILGTVGFMFGAGGSAIVARLLGEGKPDEANRSFSLIVCVAAAVGVVLAVAGAILMEVIARALGANEDMLPVCVLYGRISMISLPAFALQFFFQTFMVTAGKPRLGLGITVAAGLANMVLDWLFVGVLGWGVTGAAVATNVSEFVGGLVPLAYFARRNTSLLRLVRPGGGGRLIVRVCTNGSSELVSSIASSVVSMVYNLQLMALIGPDGVSAYGVIMYVWMVFGAVFIGYTQGVAPLMSYAYGARDVAEMRSLLRRSLAIMVAAGVAMLVLSHLLARPLAMVFTGYDQGLCDLTVHAFSIYSVMFVFAGVAIYASSLFTSLGNGAVSAVVSFLRTFVFEIGSVLLLPLVLGPDGIWFSVIIAEAAAVVVSGILLWWLAPGYGLTDRRDRKDGGDRGGRRGDQDREAGEDRQAGARAGENDRGDETDGDGQ